MTEQDEATTLVGGTCTWTWYSASKMWVPVCHCDPGYRCGPHPLTKDQLIDDLSTRLQQAQEQIRSGGTSDCQGGPSMSDAAFRDWVRHVNKATGSHVVVPEIPDDPAPKSGDITVELPCVLAFQIPGDSVAPTGEG